MQTEIPAATILLVENEADVLRTLTAFLGKAGYRVLPCFSPRQVLDHWHQESGQIDLLITDLDLDAEMNGLELADLLIAQRPTLKVIYMSGGSSDLFGAKWSEHNCLAKPFPLDELRQMMRRILSGQSSL